MAEETKKFLLNESNLEDILTYLEEVNSEYLIRENQKNSEASGLLSKFDEKESKAFNEFLESINGGDGSRISMDKGSCVIDIRETEALMMSIILENAYGENIESDILWDHAELSKSDDTYLLELVCSDYLDGEDILGKISFSTMSLNIQLYNYTLSVVSRGNSVPWDTLTGLLGEIEAKRSLGSEYINEKEEELLPLCNLELFRPSIFDTVEFDDSQYEKLTIYIERSNCQKLLPILDSIRKSETKKRRQKYIKEFKNEIIKFQYEPLWRSIFDDVKAAASEYPSKAEVLCEQVQLKDIRSVVSKKFFDAGFQGEYPHFRKMGSLDRLHLAEINGITYWVGYEKNMASYVDCMEFCYDGTLTLYFVIGIILLKPDKLDTFNKLDAFSGFFHDRARRTGKVLCGYIPKMLPDSSRDLGDLLETVSIAIKKSMFQKLSGSERKNLNKYDIDKKSILMIGLIWTIAGILYGFMMTVSFMIFELIVGLIDSSGSISEAWAFFIQTPWWIFFAGTSFGFGILMLIISLFAQRS
ncbi:hypothetical protein J2Z34_000109 [Youngiibacter multivorans]|uniref:Uncharacterized protein n=1 Tax=Youngiibacter multivorans TaxID=937251 RepID=A0ABS4FZK1_9CLOT|nr:hypothetical protein [Youngiibacter multivorans]